MPSYWCCMHRLHLIFHTLQRQNTSLFYKAHVCLHQLLPTCNWKEKKKVVSWYSYCLRCHLLDTSPWNNKVMKLRAPLIWVSYSCSTAVNTTNNCYCVRAKNKTDLTTSEAYIGSIFAFLEYPTTHSSPSDLCEGHSRYITGSETFSLESLINFSNILGRLHTTAL